MATRGRMSVGICNYYRPVPRLVEALGSPAPTSWGLPPAADVDMYGGRPGPELSPGGFAACSRCMPSTLPSKNAELCANDPLAMYVQ